MSRLAVLWITNVSAPYRRPLWAELAARCAIQVALLSENESNRRWSAELPEDVGRSELRTLILRRGERHLYVLLGLAMRGKRPDAVILPGWENPAAWQCLLEARLKNVPCVAFYESSVHSHRFKRGPIPVLRRVFFRHVDSVLTVGQASTQAALGFGVRPEFVVQSHNAVDVGELRKSALNQLPSTDGERARRYVYVGQLIDRKNVEDLLRALALLDEDTELTIAGEGPNERVLRSLAVDLGIDRRVRFVGYLDPAAVPHELARAATLVLPSRVEVYGLVVNEALASGLHVVVSKRAGIYLDVAGMAGVFGSESEPESLAEAMRRSRATWRGPISQPEVMQWTPAVMATAVLRAVEIARSSRTGAHSGGGSDGGD